MFQKSKFRDFFFLKKLGGGIGLVKFLNTGGAETNAPAPFGRRNSVAFRYVLDPYRKSEFVFVFSSRESFSLS